MSIYDSVWVGSQRRGGCEERLLSKIFWLIFIPTISSSFLISFIKEREREREIIQARFLKTTFYWFDKRFFPDADTNCTMTFEKYSFSVYYIFQLQTLILRVCLWNWEPESQVSIWWWNSLIRIGYYLVWFCYPSFPGLGEVVSDI